MKNNMNMGVGHVGTDFAGRVDLKAVVDGASWVQNYYAPRIAGGMIKRPGFRLIYPYTFGVFKVFSVGNVVLFGRPGKNMYAVSGLQIAVDAEKDDYDDGDIAMIPGDFSVNQYVYVENATAKQYIFSPGLDRQADLPTKKRVVSKISVNVDPEDFMHEEFLGRLSLYSKGKAHIIEAVGTAPPFEQRCYKGQTVRYLPEKTWTDNIKLNHVTRPEGLSLSAANVVYTASARYQQRNILATYDPSNGRSELLISAIPGDAKTSIIDGLFGKWYRYYTPDYIKSDADAQMANRVKWLPKGVIIENESPDALRYDNEYYSPNSQVVWLNPYNGNQKFDLQGTPVLEGGKLSLHHGSGRVTMLGAIDDLLFIGTEYNVLYTQALLTKPVSRKIYPKGAAEVAPVNIGNNLVFVSANGKTLMYISKPPEAAPIVQIAPLVSDFLQQKGGVKKLVALNWSTTALIVLTNCGYLAYVRPAGDIWSVFPWAIHSAHIYDIVAFETLEQPDILYAAVNFNKQDWLICADEPQFIAQITYTPYRLNDALYKEYLDLRDHIENQNAVTDFYVSTKIKNTPMIYDANQITSTDDVFDGDQVGDVDLGNVVIYQRNVDDSKTSGAETHHAEYGDIPTSSDSYAKMYDIDIDYIYSNIPVLATNELRMTQRFVSKISMHANMIGFGAPILSVWESMVGMSQYVSFNDLNVLANRYLVWTDILDNLDPLGEGNHLLPEEVALDYAWQTVPAKFNKMLSAQRVMFSHTWCESVRICAVRF